MKGRPVRISFDETTIRCVVLCIIVGFVDDNGKMQQRVIKVGLYNEAPEEKLTNQMSDHILTAIEETLLVPRTSIKVFTRDGVYLNELCMLKLIGGVVIDPNTNKETKIRGFYPEAVNIKCMSHTLDNCGADYTEKKIQFNRIEGSNAKKVYNLVNGLFSSPGEGSKLSWLSFAKTAMLSVSPTRWWSREEFWAYLLPYLRFDTTTDDHLWFDGWVKMRVGKIRADKKAVGNLLTKLEEMFVPGTSNHDSKFLVTAFIEIAVVVDITHKVRAATYVIEGDGPVAVMIVEILDAIQRYYKTAYEEMEYQNVRRYIAQAVGLKISPPGYVAPALVLIEPTPDAIRNDGVDEDIPADVVDDVVDAAVDNLNLPRAEAEGTPIACDLNLAWREYCLKISQPYMRYFDEKVMQHNCLPLWKAAGLADPLNMQRETITPRHLRETVEPLVGMLVTPALIDRMISELSEYEKACTSLNWMSDSYEDRLKKVESFWACHKLLPAWTEYAHLVFLLQPTSACVARSFSILKYIMGDQQVSSLRDKIEASLMLRYNRGVKQ